MGRRALLFWLAVLLAFAVFGLAFLKFVAVAAGLLLLLLFGALFVGALLLRRRMNRRMAEFREAFERARADAEAQRQAHAMRRDAIDVDAEVKDPPGP